MSNKTQFRIVLAELMLAREVFYSITKKPNFSDLTGLDTFFKDGGFFHLAARPIKVLTRPRTIDEAVCKALLEKTMDFKTIFLNRELLESAEKRDLKQELTDAKTNEDLIRVDLYDTLIYKEIQNTYIPPRDNESNGFDIMDTLDSISRTITQEMAPAFHYSFVSTDTISLMSSILDLDSEEGTNSALEIMKSDKHMAGYTSFIRLMERHGI